MRVLRDDGHIGSECLQIDLRDILIIDSYRSVVVLEGFVNG